MSDFEDMLAEKILYWQARNSLHGMMFAKELDELWKAYLKEKEQNKA